MKTIRSTTAKPSPTVVEIEAKDVGKGAWAPGFPPGIRQSLGRVMLYDVGKRAYLRDGVWQVENDKQRDERLRRERGECGGIIPLGTVAPGSVIAFCTLPLGHAGEHSSPRA